MSSFHATTPSDGLEALLDRLSADAAVQSNCAFQLALMVARVSLDPCPESYKQESAQILMDLIRSKPRSNVVRLFGSAPNRRDDGMPVHGAA